MNYTYCEKTIYFFRNQPSRKDKPTYQTVTFTDTTFEKLSLILTRALYADILQLRLFSTEGVEVFQEDIKYLRDHTTLVASDSKSLHDVSGRWARLRPARIAAGV